MDNRSTLTVDGREVVIQGERNLLEVIRKANVDLPTFCYHSELSVYGACRLCIVDVQGRGIVGACSTPPEPGMVVRTGTEEVRDIRRIAIELLLASHDQSCPTCPKGPTCQLQKLARQLGIRTVRFKQASRPKQLDESSPSLVRDPSKCVLCGDCVRMCSEVQGIGAIDFVRRGAGVTVSPAFDQLLGQGECVGCGQCARVCPTGALVPKSDVHHVWKALSDPDKVVVAQVAPAVRVALGEAFGSPAGTLSIGQLVAALKHMGFRKVYDTSFAADLTAVEETAEFMARRARGQSGPLLTSCCPAWVRFAQQYYPDLLPHLSTCRSPQQMLASVARRTLPGELGVSRAQIVMVSIMPCTAKKAEASLAAFSDDQGPDVDHVLTTLELATMIEESGLRFRKLDPAPMDMPFGFKTGAGVIFGASGGVAEAVIRCAAESMGKVRAEDIDLRAARGDEAMRTATIAVGDQTLRVGIVHGLARAATVAESIRKGDCDLDLVEVMACPGGCVGGAGNPTAADLDARRSRAKSLHDADRMLELHTPQDNPYVQACYRDLLGVPGSEKAHALLHTHHQSHRRMTGEMPLVEGGGDSRVKVRVCVGTSCFLRGAQELLRGLVHHVEESGCSDRIDLAASFCQERCDRGPTVVIDGEVLERCDLTRAQKALSDRLARMTSQEQQRVPAA